MVHRVVQAVLLACVAGLLAALPAPTQASGSPECAALQAEDLAFDAPRLSGTLGDDGTCWTLPLAGGDVVLVSAAAGGPAISVTGSTDASSVCVTEDASLRCELEGPGPFLLRLQASETGASDYDVQVARLNEAQGCARLGPSLAKFWEGRRSEVGATCATVAHGSYANLRFAQPRDGSAVPFTVYDDAGQPACRRDVDDPACSLQGHDPHRVVVHAGPPQDFRLAALDLDLPRSCTHLLPGRFGSRDGIDVSLANGAFATCFRVPTDELERRPSIFAYERTSGTGEADLLVRSSALGEYGNECAATGSAGVGSVVCHGLEHSGPITTVMLTTDGNEASWRVARREPGAGVGCRPVLSTRIGGPVTTGALASFLEMDCWTVTAAAADRFAVDVLDDRSDVKMTAFEPHRQTCSESPERQCELEGHRRYQLVLGSGGTRPSPHDYELQPWQVGDLRGWSPECVRFDDYDEGWGPVKGSLSASAGGACVLVEDAGWAEYVVDVGAAEPHPILRGVGGNPWSGGTCDRETTRTYRCAQFHSPFHTGLVLISRPDGVPTMDYDVSATCAERHRCDVLPPMRAVTAPAVVGDHAAGQTLRVDTGAWEPYNPQTFDYRWLLDGDPLPPRWGWHLGRRPELLLTDAMVGHEVSVRVLTDDSWFESAVTVTEPRTVTGGPLVPLRPPSVIGRVRVGERVRAAPGRWSRQPDRFSYVWRVGGQRLARTGPGLRLRPAHAGDRLRVVVRAHAEGRAPGRAVSDTVSVRGR